MKLYNITVPKKYTKDGEERTTWNTIGKLIEFEATADKPAGKRIELFMHPDTPIYVFEQKKTEESPETPASDDNIPF